MPRQLQAQIHSDFSTVGAVWSGYRSSILDLYTGTGIGTGLGIGSGAIEDFNNHVMREFNRKIIALNQSTGLMFTPYDGGFRYNA